MTDFPDWQRPANAQGDNLMPAYTSTFTPGVHDLTVYPALSWSSLTLISQPAAGAAQLTIGHFADAAATQEIDSDTWPVNASTRLVMRTPLRGKYVRLSYNVTSAVNLVVNHWATFLAASSERISFPVGNQNLSDYDHSLAASGTQTYDSGEIAAGRALFYFKPYDAGGKLSVSLHAVDELGNSGALIADFGSPAAIIQQVIEVPDLILQVAISNNDAVSAHAYDFALTIPPQ